MAAEHTPGGPFVGVHVISADGERLRLRNAILRQVGYWVSTIFFLGFLSISVNGERQGFHESHEDVIVTYS